MSKTLTAKALKDAADEIGVELAAIRAVDEVESRGAGFTADGHAKVLFERHKFRQFTKGRFDASHPDLSNRKAGGYGPSDIQYARFSRAFGLDPTAAMKATSWGRYQIMGFNYEAAGFDSVDAFVDAMKVSENEHLKAFVKLIKAWGLAPELRMRQWASFARQYNGADYAKNKYDEKLASAYERFKVEPLVTDTVTEQEPEAEAELQKKAPEDPQPGPQINVEHADKVEAPAILNKPETVEVQSLTQSLLSKVLAGGTVVVGVITTIFGFVTQAFDKHPVPMTVLVLGILGIAAYMWNESRKRRDAREAQIVQKAASQTENTVVLTEYVPTPKGVV